MSIPNVPSGANLYTQGGGTASSNSFPMSAIRASRAPTSTDIRGPNGPYPIGQWWVDYATPAVYVLASLTSSAGVVSASWLLGALNSGDLETLSGDTGTATPSSSNIVIAGGDGITTSASGSTVTISLDGGSVAIDSFTPDAGTSPVVPTAAGLVTMAGTANQITTTGGTNVLTFSLPSSITAPGSLTTTTTLSSTTTMTCGTGFTVTTGGILVSGGDIINSHSNAGTDVTDEVTNSDNTNGASRAGVEIATGGSSSGDPYLSFQISGVAASTMTMGLDNSASDLFCISNSTAIGTSNALTLSQAGALNATTSITAGTTLTATSGAITATNGNLVLNTAGNKIVSTSVGSTSAAGANSFGTVTLVAGTVTVATTAVTASSIIMLTRQSVGATGANDLGILSVGTIVAATSFVINAWTVTNATALQTDDVSVIGWMIIN